MIRLYIDKIKSLGSINTLSKHEQLVQGTIETIDADVLEVGDQLPSINQMVFELGFARKTIVKAYEELKDRGLVESKKLKGYFIISNETKVTLKIALLLFAFQRFQEDFYNSFRKKLGKRFQIDVFFHHNNKSVFETTLNSIKGKYGMYVVAPIPDKSIQLLLERIAPQKLLVIDRYLPMSKQYSYISQMFEPATYDKLSELLPRIRKFKEMVLFFGEEDDNSIGVLEAFNNFVSDNEIKSKVESAYKLGEVKKGNLYFCLKDSNLWELLLDCRDKGYIVGKDIGVLSLDDHVAKELVSGGISTMSCDFKEMGRKAANHIKNQDAIREIMPFHLIKRNSL
jgi:DNA-binding transcriptional regulator YhcF (GntR family)